MAVSRRWFLWSTGLVPAALIRPAPASGQGLEQFAASDPPCTADPRVTPGVPLDATFRLGAPLRSSLVASGMAGTPLALSGTVTGVTCGRIAKARVDLWQADAGGVYDQAGFRLRGHQLTDANGKFTFQTIVPGPGGGRPKHLGLRVQVTGKIDFATELFFPDDLANLRDPRFKKELLLRMVQVPRGQAAIFDVVVKL